MLLAPTRIVEEYLPPNKVSFLVPVRYNNKLT